MRTSIRPALTAADGYSLVELIVAMGLMTVIMGATMSGLANVVKGNELVMTIAMMNDSVRGGLDLMVRDMLQVGSGLPSSHTVSIPNGPGSIQVRLPGPPGTSFTSDVGDVTLPAMIPRAGAGPTIGGVATDVVTMLMADNTFLEQRVSAVSASTVTVAAGPNIATGPDRIVAGQLMLISKGSYNTLVQVTNADTGTRILTFANGDSLFLNQTAAAQGNLANLNAQAPTGALAPAATRISRIRMITYYLDATTDPTHPRLVRRINNGSPSAFDNTSGTAVAIDAVDLQFTYDISNGTGNPGGVEMTSVDQGTGGSCTPVACAETQIRKVNIKVKSRSPRRMSGGSNTFLYNLLESQVSLRAMAFVDRYQ